MASTEAVAPRAPIAPGAASSIDAAWARIGPVLAVLAILIALWYAAAVGLNAAQVIERTLSSQPGWGFADLVKLTLSMDRPVLPAPHQIALDLFDSVFGWPPDSPRNLLFHAAVTSSATLLGFVMGTALGALLAVAIVHSRTLERSLFPWVIASQTVPVLAIAPIVIVILGSLGLTGVFPKAIISMYLCFFPVTVGMVKGLRSPDPLQLDLMRTYSASPAQVLWKLRNPASVPFLFASLKVAIGISLVGAIVGELPTGGQIVDPFKRIAIFAHKERSLEHASAEPQRVRGLRHRRPGAARGRDARGAAQRAYARGLGAY